MYLRLALVARVDDHRMLADTHLVFWVLGLGFGVWGLVWKLGFGLRDFGFGVWSLGLGFEV